MSLKVLVVDDAILFRRTLCDVLGEMPDVEVTGNASNGRLALQKIRELQPDVVTLDLEMPEMDGLAVLDALRKAEHRPSVIVVSALTRRGGDLTMRALEKGAFDFITKPDTSSAAESREVIRRELTPRIRALHHRKAVRSILRGGASPASPAPAAIAPAATHAAPAPAPKPAAPGLEGIAGRMNRLIHPSRPEMVLIGVSTGGPNALSILLPHIPGDIGVPILVVQHMPPMFTQSLAESLGARCSLRVREGAHGELVVPNTVYIAPGGRQMRVGTGADGTRSIQITDDPPENNCRPSVDYLFRSVSMNCPGRAMAVILTGMGSDGTLGLRLLKRHGCHVIAQDEASCVVFGMPKAAIEAGLADVILPLDAIASKITTTIRGGGA